jgi:membrane associated rhomboid family serine protease
VKPYAVWSIAALTVLVSLVWFAFLWSAPEGMHPSGSQLMLWGGSQPAAEERSAELLEMIDEAEQAGELEAGEATELRQMAGQATLPFEPYQVLTHALLHDGILHLAGNLLFLLVLGTRVNALIGNVKTAIIYPILAVAGGVAHMIASRDEPATPMLGASGAIMGLAGMYLVLFPAYRVHMAAWIRLFIFVFGVTIFAVRGFWVVLFYIAFDVVAAALRAESGVAHWAHLGGFMAGVATALLLLLTRNVHAHGGDILSVALGRRAWPLLGRPTSYRSPTPTPAAAAAEVTSPAA